ncbi:MAG: glutaredoxin 3 [Rickettsia endosymbiont of Glossina mortisans submortisans]|nr:glutaredoxin 3 [Rickettsia endosymbiont of Glossina mortisans submortisans]
MNKAILHTIIIYTLASCPYCIKAKALLDEKNVVYEKIEVSNFTQEEKEKFIKKSGEKKTVPQIFIDNMHIGGCDALFDLEKEGRLDKLLEGQPKKKTPAAGGRN